MTTTTPLRAAKTLAARPPRPRLEMRWTVQQAPGGAPTLVARWATDDVVAPQRRAA